MDKDTWISWRNRRLVIFYEVLFMNFSNFLVKENHIIKGLYRLSAMYPAYKIKLFPYVLPGSKYYPISQSQGRVRI